MPTDLSRPESLLTLPVKPLTLRLALPGFVSMAVCGACALAEALFLSGTPLAPAVSAGYSLLLLFQTIGFTLGTGAGSVVSRSLGGGKTQEAEGILFAAPAAALLASLCVAVPGLLFSKFCFSLLGLPEDTLSACRPYLLALLACGPLLCLHLVLTSLMRAQGRTAPAALSPLPGALLGAAALFLLFPFLGVWAALAAVFLREGLTLLLALFFSFRDKMLLRPRASAFRPAVLGRVFCAGLPTLFRQGAACLCSILLNRTCAQFGTPVLVGMGLAVRTSALVSACVIGFGQGLQPVCGTNFGAGQLGRCQEAYSFCQKITFAALFPAGLLLFGQAVPLLRLFGAEEAAVQFGASCLRAQSLAFFAQGALVLMTVLTQSMGLTTRASFIAVSRQAFFLPLLLALPRWMGQNALIFSQSAADLLALFFSFLLTRGLFSDSSQQKKAALRRSM